MSDSERNGRSESPSTAPSRPGSSTAVPGAESFLDLLATTRSIRRYDFAPVPEEDLNTILWAATRAPSGTNRQPFRFLVLRDGPRAGEARRILGEAFRSGWRDKCESEGWAIDIGTRGSSKRERMLQSMHIFVDRFEDIPVVILAIYLRYRAPSLLDGASIFPACQNLLVAARARGYGACFSAWHLPVETELASLLGLPDHAEIALTVTLGKPIGNHGPVRRLPMSELVFEESWESAAPWAQDPQGSRFTGGGPPR